MKIPTPEFIKNNELNDDEKELLRCALAGEVCVCADGSRPEPDDQTAPTIDAKLIRFLARGGNDKHSVDPYGVRLKGARITGTLTLEGCRDLRTMSLDACHFDEAPILRDAAGQSISFSGSYLPRLFADRLTTTGGVFLRYGFEAAGTVRFMGAKIGGNLECDGGKFLGKDKDGNALIADGLATTGAVFLRQGFEAAGAVRLRGAAVGGYLDCVGGKFLGKDKNGNALHADGLTTTGDVILRDGVEAAGAVRLLGAKIGGTLDCEGGKILGKDKKGNALHADGLTTTGGVFLRQGFEAAGPVRLLGAKIGGVLDCSGGKFLGTDEYGNALGADGLTTTGGAFLRHGFEAAGSVRLLGAMIGDSLSCVGGKFLGRDKDGNALHADGLTTTGNVFLNDGFEATGAVRLAGAKIGGDLVCVGGKFTGEPSALILHRGCVTGVFFWKTAKGDRPTGTVDLSSPEVGDLSDDLESWPKGGVILDGFRYGGIIGAPTSYATRKDWLERQRREHLTNDFKPQPFEQLGNFYRTYGHYSDARRVAILKNDLMGKTGETKWYARLLHRLYGAFLGYGYAPLRAFRLVPVFLVLGPLIFFAAYRYGAMVPNNPFVLRSDGWMDCISQEEATDITATDCWLTWPQSLSQKTRAKLLDPPVRGKDFPEFHAAVYALDTFVPFVNLHQEPYWIPDAERGPSIDAFGWEVSWGAFARAYLWLHILSGWTITALLAASFTGLVKKDV